MHKFLVPIILLAFISTNFTHAQDFIITAKGDTLRGKVKITGTNVEKRIQLVTTAKEKKIYSIFQVRMAFIDSSIYHPVKFGESYTYMKLLKDGYLKLYAFQVDNQTTYDGQFLLKVDGQGMEIPNLTFKKNMIKFLNECPTVASQIQDGTLGRNDISKLIDAFNLCIENNTQHSIGQSTIVKPISNLPEWTDLENKIQSSTLVEKQNALDMVADIKGKLGRGEKIPKFLSDALMSALSPDPELMTALNKALGSISK